MDRKYLKISSRFQLIVPMGNSLFYFWLFRPRSAIHVMAHSMKSIILACLGAAEDRDGWSAHAKTSISMSLHSRSGDPKEYSQWITNTRQRRAMKSYRGLRGMEEGGRGHVLLGTAEKTNYSFSLDLSFLICKVNIIIVPIS